MSKRLSPAQIEHIVAQYRAGHSIRSIASEHGVSASAVSNLLRRNAITVSTRTVSDAEAARMARDYVAGLTIRELEDKYGRSHGAVLRALKKQGIEMRAKAPRKR